MFALTVVVWPIAPDRIPVHWDISGRPDRYGGKFEGLLLLPLTSVGLYLLFLLLPRIDPRRRHYAEFSTVYNLFRTAFLAFMLSLQLLIVLWGLKRPVDVGAYMSILAGLLFVVVGNYLPKVRSNWFVGIRTPWTLSSELSWSKTHRLGGKLLVAWGLLVIVFGALRPQWAFWVLIGGAVLITAVTVVYSYAVWKREAQGKEA